MPKTRAKHTDPESASLDARKDALAGMIRQWLYSRVTRRANLARHISECAECRARAARRSEVAYCYDGRGLMLAVDTAREQLERLTGELEQLEQPPPEPEPAAPATLFD